MKRNLICTIALTICILMLVLCFTACGSKDTKTPSNGKKTDTTAANEETKSLLIGTWAANESEGMSYIFNEDGTGKWDAGDYALDFNYVDKGNSIEITYKGSTDAQTWEYTISDDTLSMKDTDSGVTLTYTKK